MDVVVWLRSLGLGKYEAAFRENEIDETVLPNLTVTWALVPVAIDDGEMAKSADQTWFGTAETPGATPQPACNVWKSPPVCSRLRPSRVRLGNVS